MARNNMAAASPRDIVWRVVIGTTIIIGLPFIIAATHLAVG